MNLETETIDKLFLELSQFSRAKTKRDLEHELKINCLKKYAEKLVNAKLMDWFQGIGVVNSHWSVEVVRTVGRRILKELEDKT